MQLNKTALKINWEELYLGDIQGNDNDKFTIVDPQGNTYQFGLGAVDRSDVVSYPLGSYNDCMQRSLSDNDMLDIPTTWHLKQISYSFTAGKISIPVWLTPFTKPLAPLTNGACASKVLEACALWQSTHSTCFVLLILVSIGSWMPVYAYTLCL